MKICVLLLVFVALLLAVSMEKWKSCYTFRYHSLSPSRLECSSVKWVWVWAWVASCSRGANTQTNRIFGHGSTRLCCLNKFGALIMLYTSSSSAGSHPAPPPSSSVSSSTWVTKRRVALAGRNALTGPWREIAYRAIMLYGK